MIYNPTFTTKEAFIHTASGWGTEYGKYIVVKQNHDIILWVKKGYLEHQMSKPMEEYMYVSVSLTELGKTILDFEKL